MANQQDNVSHRASTPHRSASRPEPRVLRVGVVHQGRIVEERILRPGQQLSVGSNPECSVVLPASAATQRRFPLLSARGGRYHLRFTAEMRGKVSSGRRVDTLKGLSDRGVARGRRGSWDLPLRDDHRGKVYVEDHAVLFQFVAPPPMPARTRSVEYRRPSFQGSDLVFLAILLFSALLHTAAVVWIDSQPAPQAMRYEEIPDRFVVLALRQDPKPEPEPEPTPAETAEPTPVAAATPVAAVTPSAADTPSAPEPSQPGPQTDVPDPAPAVPSAAPETASQRAERIRKESSGKGLLMLIPTAGESSNPTLVGDFLANANNLDGDVGTALTASNGVVIGRHREDVGLRSGGGGNGLVGSTGVEAAQVGETAGPVRTPHPILRDPDQPLDTSAEPEAAVSISRRIKHYNGRIKSCYERELKADPSLAGKVTISFEINTLGKVSGVGIEENTTRNSDLEQCIKREVSRFRFNPAPPDPIEVAGYPYLLSPG